MNLLPVKFKTCLPSFYIYIYIIEGVGLFDHNCKFPFLLSIYVCESSFLRREPQPFLSYPTGTYTCAFNT